MSMQALQILHKKHARCIACQLFRFMHWKIPSMVAFALALVTSQAQFSDYVMSYWPGTGTGTLTNAIAAIGSPASADPFHPPTLDSQVVSIGAGGSLTLGFNAPVPNGVGYDLNFFGNSSFFVTTGGITDGTVIGNSSGQARIWLSEDGVDFYRLGFFNTPLIDDLYPTDSEGDFHRAMPALISASEFAGRDLAGVRALYNGSAGGVPINFDWAEDAGGNPVHLNSVSLLRIENPFGPTFDLDAVAVVPEPSSYAILGSAVVAALAMRRRMPKGQPRTI